MWGGGQSDTQRSIAAPQVRPVAACRALHCSGSGAAPRRPARVIDTGSQEQSPSATACQRVIPLFPLLSSVESCRLAGPARINSWLRQ